MGYNPAIHKTGKLPPVIPVGTPHFTSILNVDAPPTPDECDYFPPGIEDFGDMGNNDRGDCSIAGLGHGEQIATVNAYQKMWSATPQQCLSTYSKWCGWDPLNPEATDRGGVLSDVLDKAYREGFCGRRISGYAQVDFRNIDAIKRAIFLGGGVYTGQLLPARIQTQGNDWTVPWNVWFDAMSKKTIGGHCTWYGAFSKKTKRFKMISWGGIYTASEDWVARYMDECWAVIFASWIRNGKSPGGIDEASLLRFMARKDARA